MTETVTETVTAVASGDGSGLCGTDAEAFFTELRELDSRISVGMTLPDYVTRIGDIAVVRDKIDANALTPECAAAIAAAELAFTSFQKAGSRWSKCVRAGNCRDWRTQRTLQTLWKNASERLDRADALWRRISK